MICTTCKKENLYDSDMHSDTMCNDCFDLMLEQEDKDFDVYYSQMGLCFLCAKPAFKWGIKLIDTVPRAICSCCNISS